MRSQFILDLNQELIVDNFAGGGGASTGIFLATGRHVDHARNHDHWALGMHRINHPQTIHHREDIFSSSPETICERRPVGLAHFSPDCKHFSKAKGGKPLDKRIRGLVLEMLRWAKYGARVMTMENVEEIVSYGPLIRRCKGGKWDWYADPDHKGRTWNAFLSILSTGIDPDHPDLPDILEVLGGYITKAECVRGFGYHYEARQIRACDLGTPTIRKRLYMIARRDGAPIVWPEATHAPKESPRLRGAGKLKPYRTIAECIDWDLPCPSIFLDKSAARKARCKRPLVKATLRRIAKGTDRHVLKAKRPFIVSLTHQGGDRVESVDEPARVVTAAHRGEKAVVAPVVTRFNGDHAGRADGSERNIPVTEPLTTQDTSNRFGLSEAKLAPFITEHANSSHEHSPAGGCMPADEPGRTTCAGVKGGHFAMVTGTLIGAGGPAYSGKPKPVDTPMNAQTTENHAALVSATIIGAGGRASQSRPRSVDEELHTITAKGDTCLAAASMVKLRGNADTHAPGHPADEPGHTISAGGTHHGLIAASIVRQFGESVGQTADGPSPTVMPGGGGKTGIIAAHLTKFCTGSVGQELEEPGPTITAGSHSPATHGGAATPLGLCAAYLAQHNGGENGHQTVGHDARDPFSTISSKGSQQQVVAAHLGVYYGTEKDGQSVDDPLRVATGKARFGLMESTAVAPMTQEQIAGARRVAAFLREYGVEFDGEFATVDGYVIIDLGMRMLTPRELFRAQGFGDEYVIDRAWVIDPATGILQEIRLTKEQQIRMCGNSVCPQVMKAIVEVNCPELIIWEQGERAA